MDESLLHPPWWPSDAMNEQYFRRLLAAWQEARRQLVDLPCPPIPRIEEEAVRAMVAYHLACRQGDWPEAARALSALEVYRLMGVRV